MAPQDDIDRIMGIMATAFDPAFGEAWTRRQVEGAIFQPSCIYWLIAPDGTIGSDSRESAGFAMVRRVLDEAELLLFAVAPAWRRRGLGASLLQKVQSDLARDGVAQMMLEMRRGNPAQALYCAYGFAPIGLRPQYYRSREGTLLDAITFSCLLDEQDA